MSVPLLVSQINNLIVRFPNESGQGVIIPGGYVLTAAHCLYDPATNEPLKTNNSFLDMPMPLDVILGNGHLAKLIPLFVDAVSDVAILGTWKNKDWEPGIIEGFSLFEEYVFHVDGNESGFVNDIQSFEKILAWVHTHNEGWKTLEVCPSYDMPNGLSFATIGVSIEGGTSGGPIVDENGRIIGVVSNGIQMIDQTTGTFSLACSVLPTWYFTQLASKYFGPVHNQI